MSFSICQKCGADRHFFAERCPQCQFKPVSPRELAIAALLTAQWESGEATFGTHPDDLRVVQRQIREGIEFKPPEQDVVRHQEAVMDFLSVKPVHLLAAMVRFLLPAILLLGALVGLALLIRFLRQTW